MLFIAATSSTLEGNDSFAFPMAVSRLVQPKSGDLRVRQISPFSYHVVLRLYMKCIRDRQQPSGRIAAKDK
jgi:hypothetical protein